MVDWEKIDTVLLDMDGTLLDLNFDNHFWKEFVPQHYAIQNDLSITEAKIYLEPLFENMTGKLEWYCLDYWSDKLQLDIIGLKQEIAGLISVLPHVTDFLSIMQQSHRRVVLVTNAHPDGLALKMEKTCIHQFFDAIYHSHQFGHAKEDQRFWWYLKTHEPFQLDHTLFVDDSISVLNAARSFGIRYLVTIRQPDTKRSPREITEYPVINDFRELLHGA